MRVCIGGRNGPGGGTEGRVMLEQGVQSRMLSKNICSNTAREGRWGGGQGRQVSVRRGMGVKAPPTTGTLRRLPTLSVLWSLMLYLEPGRWTLGGRRAQGGWL